MLGDAIGVGVGCVCVCIGQGLGNRCDNKASIMVFGGTLVSELFCINASDFKDIDKNKEKKKTKKKKENHK